MEWTSHLSEDAIRYQILSVLYFSIFILGALLRMTVKLSLFQHGHTEKRKFPTLYLRNYFTASLLDYFDDMLITFRQTEKI